MDGEINIRKEEIDLLHEEVCYSFGNPYREQQKKSRLALDKLREIAIGQCQYIHHLDSELSRFMRSPKMAEIDALAKDVPLSSDACEVVIERLADKARQCAAAADEIARLLRFWISEYSRYSPEEVILRGDEPQMSDVHRIHEIFDEGGGK